MLYPFRRQAAQVVFSVISIVDLYYSRPPVQSV
jgi:hypothetical protein